MNSISYVLVVSQGKDDICQISSGCVVLAMIDRMIGSILTAI